MKFTVTNRWQKREKRESFCNRYHVKVPRWKMDNGRRIFLLRSLSPGQILLLIHENILSENYTALVIFTLIELTSNGKGRMGYKGRNKIYCNWQFNQTCGNKCRLMGVMGIFVQQAIAWKKVTKLPKLKPRILSWQQQLG